MFEKRRNIIHFLRNWNIGAVGMKRLRDLERYLFPKRRQFRKKYKELIQEIIKRGSEPKF